MVIVGTAGGLLFTAAFVPCLAILAGVASGFLAGQFDQPETSRLAARAGAGAGALGGIGALLAHLLGAIIYLTVSRAAEASGDPLAFSWGGISFAGCSGLFEVVLMAGVGALGGLLWYQITGKNNGSAGTPAAM